MNNEKMNQIIESAWQKYANSHYTPGNPNGKLLSEQLLGIRPMMHNRETFKKEIIKNPSFASQWGLKIEERELSLEERFKLQMEKVLYSGPLNFEEQYIKDVCDKNNIPTKLITVTYKDERVEIYE